MSTRNLKLKTPHKFTPKFISPFRILECVSSLAYRLALPEKYSRLHNVFPISLLEPWHGRSQEDARQMPMPELEDDEEWEVEEVREEKRIDGETLFFIKWKGWPSEFNQWVSEEDMANAWKLVDRFRKERERGKQEGKRNDLGDKHWQREEGEPPTKDTRDTDTQPGTRQTLHYPEGPSPKRRKKLPRYSNRSSKHRRSST